MREIKFRAWDNEYKYMNYKVLVGNVLNTDINYTAHAMWIEPKYVAYKKEAGWCHFDEHSNIELMQYTGLKDKNGVEVYEGDLIKTKNSLYKVIYDKCCFWGIDAMGKYPIYQIKHYVLEDEIFKVIGNIYENPELLGD